MEAEALMAAEAGSWRHAAHPAGETLLGNAVIDSVASSDAVNRPSAAVWSIISAG